MTKSPFEIFNLTKREQRVVIVIVLALLAATIVSRYREDRSPLSSPPSPISGPSPSPSAEEQDDQEVLDEAR